MNAILRLLVLVLLPIACLQAQIPSYVPTNGLIGWWPFNGNANDESGNGNNGVNYGANLTSDRFGSSNSAYIFNGLSNYIEVASSSSLSLSNALTISVWVQVSSYASGGFPYQPAIVSKISNEDWYGGYEIRAMNDINGTGSTLGTSGRIGGNFINLNKPNNPTNEWLNLLVTYNGFQIKLYINGTIVDSTDVNGELETSDLPLRFGRRGGAGDNNCWFNGKIDDVGIWRRSLSNQEITQIYQSKNTKPIIPIYVPQNGLIGWWPFNGNANDESGNGLNGSVNGASLTNDRNGNPNKAYNYDGTSSYINIGNSSNLNTGTISISCWINPDKLLTPSNFGPTILSKREPSGWGASFQMNIARHSFWADWTIGGNGGIYHEDSSKLLIDTNTYAHLVYTHDINKVRLYLNGKLVEEIVSSGLLDTNSIPLWFGARPDSIQFFSGVIDDIAIWNRALTQNEIGALYLSGIDTIPIIPTVKTISTVSCFGGNDGIATVTHEGGIGPYTYAWNTTPVQTTQTATNLSAGTYTVTVKDSRDSIATASITITQPPAITNVIASVTKNVDCFGESGGSASVSNPTGGTPPYAYSWNTIPEQKTQIATDLKAGSYTVTVIDSKGCIAQSNVNITQPSSAVEVDSAIIENQISCYGFSDGIISIPTPIGGTPPYTVVWNTQPVSYSERVVGVGAGTYTAVVIDAKGCIAETSITIGQPAQVQVISPKDTVVLIQTNAIFAAGTNNERTRYQWQTNLGTGFQNIQDIFQYLGTKTPVLNVLNCTLFNHNQPFRCILTTNGCYDTTDIATLSIRTNVSVDESDEVAGISISPNPTGESDQFLVRFAEIPDQDVSIELLDILGSIHYSNTLQVGSESCTIPVQGLSSGMYMLRVRMNNEVFIEKVIIN